MSRIKHDPGFVHLRVHSAYSLLEGALPVADLIKLAKADDQPALAITDTGNLFGALEFSEKASGTGLQPITGCQIAVDIGLAQEDAKKTSSPVYVTLVLLAASEEGYANLVRLVSRSYINSPDGTTAHVPQEDLKAYADGIICLTGGTNGPVNRMLLANQPDEAEKHLLYLKACFQDRLYVELQRHELDDEQQIECELVNLAYAHDVPLVATNEPFFPKKDDFEAHDALIAIAEGTVVAVEDRRRLSPDFYFKSRDEMVALFSDLPEAIANTIEIARRCHVRPLKRPPILPRFTEGKPDDVVDDVLAAEAAELRRQAEEGLQKRLDAHGPAEGLTVQDYIDRLEYELGIIDSMKFPGYFLIVADFIKWAKQHDIPVGPGRGSGAGSLVAYSLTITDLDPLQFSLLFERFLNPERVSMPDFDVDFCQDKREQVIRYVQEKYGRDNVAQIITYGTLQARAVLRDVGRALQMPYGQVDRLTKLVPANPSNPVTLSQAIEEEPRLQEARDAEPIVARLLDISLRLEGLYRHASTHAAGIVIGDRPLSELVPLYRDPRSDMPVTQFNMKWVEQAGLVKFDFLGLKTLTTLDTAVKLIKQRDIHVDLAKVPIDDPESYALLSRGETVGVFQLESAGMRAALAEMKADRFEDIIALVALYRPGPMDNIPTYCARKHGHEEPDYLHDDLETVLKETHGVIIYQEQVMQIAQILSGYSLGEADLLRRAMGKKIKEEMDVQRVRFVDGAVERGNNKDQVSYIFDLVAKFANYGFNKSHAAAYALVAYHTAYLKANYPVEFMAASMTLDMGNTDKLSDFRQEVMRMGIEIVPPSINESGIDFDVSNGKIYYALAAIKGVGRPVIDHILEVRADGPFKDISDFATRINPRIINKRTMDNLISAGAFDCLTPNRAQLLQGMDAIMAVANQAMESQTSGQHDIFGSIAEQQTLRLPMTPPWMPAEQLQREFSAIGFYLSAHPLDQYQAFLEKQRVQLWADFERAVKAGASAGRLAGTIASRQERKTRKGNRMGIISFSDPSGQFEAVLFAEGLGQFQDMLEPGKSVILGVGAELRGDEVRVRLQSVKLLEDEIKKENHKMRLFIKEADPVQMIATQLKKGGDGEVSFILQLDEGRKEVEIKLKGRYHVTPDLAGSLKMVPGIVNVELV